MRLGKRDTGIIVYSKMEDEDRPREGILGLIVTLFYFYMGIYGAVSAILKSFLINYDRKLIFWGIFLFGLFLMMVYLTGRYRLIAVGFTVAAYFILLYNNYKSILAGDLNKAILFTVFVWSAALFWGGVRKGGRLFSLVNIALVLAAGLLVGRIPGFVQMCMMSLYVIGNFSMEEIEDGKRSRDSGIIMAVMAVCLLLVGHFAVVPMIRPWFAGSEELRARIQSTSLIQALAEKIPDWRDDKVQGGVGHGDLNNIESFDEDDRREVAEISLKTKPESPIYLQCYTGDVYTGEEWLETKDSLGSEIAKQYFSIFGLMDLEYDNMQIDVNESEQSYPYRPYFSEEAEKVGNVDFYNYYPLDKIQNLGDVLQAGSSLEEYKDFVYQNYVDYPDGRLARLEAQCRENQKDSLEEITEYIKDTLMTGASYNLQVGKFPEDEEFTEYFLYEKREGYCVHFATAAVLMFRMYGVPARFVTGYIVPKDDFYADAGGYKAVVESTRAHAWAEIYTEDKGWMPVETTPGYIRETTRPVPQTEKAQIRETQTEQKQTEDIRITDEPHETDEKYSINTGMVWRVILVLGLILAVIVRRHYIVRKRKRKPVKEIFYDIIMVLEFAGLPREVECEGEIFVQEVTKRFEWLDSSEVRKMMEIVMKANFDREKATREETRYMRKLYGYICKRLYSSLPLGKRIAARFIFCWF